MFVSQNHGYKLVKQLPIFETTQMLKVKIKFEYKIELFRTNNSLHTDFLF